MANMQKENRKQIRKYISLGIGAAVVLLLAVMPMLAAARDAKEENQASILSAAASNMDIATSLLGGGQLSSEASIQVKIPEHVKLTELLAGNGDTVSRGDPIAKVDRVSVMSAIMDVQETLDHLAEEISAAVEDTESESVRAQAGGIVKILYGQKGETAQEVMLRDGCLAVLSLDGLMAVQIQRYTDLKTGDKVNVSLPDDTQVEGRVADNRDGVLTVTVTDNKYDIGTKVTVKTQDDDRIGSGELYIYSQWNATAYSGTIYDIQVRENEKVAAGRVMFLLRDSGNTAQFQRLVDQRQEYEELMQELFVMYQTQTITSPCDGIVSGVDEDGAYLLVQQEQSWVAKLLSFFEKEKKTGFTAFAVQVEKLTENGMTLQIDPEAVYVEDLTKLSATAVSLADMTQNWNYVGDTTVYSQDPSGLLQVKGTAEPGDLLLMVGNEEKISWFVSLEEDAALRVDQTEKTEISDSHSGHTAYSLFWGPGNGGEWPGEDNWPGGDDNESGGNESDPDGDGGDTEGEGNGAGGDGNEPGDTEPAVTYLGYVAKVTEIAEGTMKVLQTEYSYTITDLENLPAVSVDANALTQEMTYTGDLITADAAAVEDYLLLIVNADGSLAGFVKQTLSQNGAGEEMEGEVPGEGQGSAGMPSGGGMPGGMDGIGGAMQQEQPFEMYTLEKVSVASVTSQEHMTLSITIDELEISHIYAGQSAVVSVDALGGEQFDATVTKISNSGVNEGGNSKFTVDLTLARSGDMLPGMYSSAVITLETASSVLCIPVAALEKDGKDSIVYTGWDKETGTLQDPVVVTLGTSDGENVQILSGLTQGQMVYYAYYDTYTGSADEEISGFSFGRMGRPR